MNECPCINCVCIPICRHKTFLKMHADCHLVSYYIRCNLTFGSFIYRIEIRDVLNPTQWEVDSDGIFIDKKFPPVSV